MSKAKYFWNRMAKSYDKQVEKKYKQAYSDTIALSKKYLRSDFSVLDLACGTGLTTIELAKSVKKTDAIDISAKMIEIARLKLKMKT